MHKPLEYNGKKYSEADAFRQAKATSSPRSVPQADGNDGMSHGKPMHTVHNGDGSHTTTHEDGHEHNSENLEALKAHLDKFLTEEEQEGGGDDGWGDE